MSTDHRPGYPEPPASGGELETLLGSLERQRATFGWKCSGLSSDGLAARVGRSEITLGGLLVHLAYMEDLDFSRDLAGRALPAPWDDPALLAGEGVEWDLAASRSPDQLEALWHDAVDRSRSAVAEALARGGPEQTFTTAGGATCSLRRQLVDLVEEYARHTGHADLIRESVDGRVGEDPPGRPYPYRLG
jgi:hypothetical protein